MMRGLMTSERVAIRDDSSNNTLQYDISVKFRTFEAETSQNQNDLFTYLQKKRIA